MVISSRSLECYGKNEHVRCTEARMGNSFEETKVTPRSRDSLDEEAPLFARKLSLHRRRKIRL